jgi:hypothetical protein
VDAVDADRRRLNIADAVTEVNGRAGVRNPEVAPVPLARAALLVSRS